MAKVFCIRSKQEITELAAANPETIAKKLRKIHGELLDINMKDAANGILLTLKTMCFEENQKIGG